MKRFALVLVLALSAACTRTAPAADAPPQGESAAARWEAQGLRSYRFDFERHCFCVREATEPVTITVRDGAVAEVRSRRTGAVVPPSENVAWPTLDELLRQVAEAEASGTEARVRYHESGYPAEIEIGSLAADAGVRFTVANLVPVR